MDAGGKRRWHSLVYGLYYPAVLGTGIVVALLRAAKNTIQDPAISVSVAVAVTAGVFFSLSFAAAEGFEDKYGPFPFFLDVVEVIAMFACLYSLGFIDISSPVQRPATVAYAILLALVVLQLFRRNAVNLNWDACLDLKIMVVLSLSIGAIAGNKYPCLHWAITFIISLLALLYVRSDPYKQDKPAPRWYFARTDQPK
jgi:hypothetical protein